MLQETDNEQAEMQHHLQQTMEQAEKTAGQLDSTDPDRAARVRQQLKQLEVGQQGQYPYLHQQPSEQDTFTHLWVSVGPTLQTVGQH